ncbi:MAG: acyl-CoA dehydrogenase family protein [Clostridia bacterium]
MDFNFSSEQYLLRDSAHDLFSTIAGPETARAAYREGAAAAERVRSALAEQGMLGAGVPENFGGSALTPLDMALIFEASGQDLLTYPLLETYVAARILAAAPTGMQERLYPAIASGDHVMTVAWGSEDGLWTGAGVQAVGSGETRLYGRRTFVPFAGAATLVVTPVEWKQAGGVALAALDPRQSGIEIVSLESLDGSYPLAALEFHGAALEPDAIIGYGGALWGEMRRTAWVGLASEALGAAERAFRETVEYVKVREQFGQPVGRFQAVKHVAADDYLLVESARVANRYAAWAVTEQEAEAELYAALAKSYASDMAREATSDAIQLHGGIGYTWDSDMHLYFKRGWRIAAELGTPVEIREQMARQVLDGSRMPGPLAPVGGGDE